MGWDGMTLVLSGQDFKKNYSLMDAYLQNLSPLLGVNCFWTTLWITARHFSHRLQVFWKWLTSPAEPLGKVVDYWCASNSRRGEGE